MGRLIPDGSRWLFGKDVLETCSEVQRIWGKLLLRE